MITEPFQKGDGEFLMEAKPQNEAVSQNDRMKDLLKIKNYRLLLLGQLVAMIGDGVYTLSLVWAMKVLTGSSVQMSFVLAANVIPIIILGIFAGVIVDRGRQKRIMMMANLCRGIVAFLLFLTFFLDVLQPWMLIAAAAILASFSAFFTPARAVAIKTIVPEQLIARAQSISSTVQVLTGLIAPAIAGILLAIDLQLAFLFQAVMFFISIVCIWFVKQKELMERREHGKLNKAVFIKDLKTGFRTIMTVPILRGLILYLVLINFIFAPVEILLPTYASSASQLASIQISFVIGILTGSIAINFFLKLPKIVPIVTGLLLMMISFGVMSFVDHFVISCLLVALIGFGSPLANISLSTLFMIKVPREVIGRSQSTMNVLLESTNPIALLLTGVLLVSFTIQQMFLFISIAGLLIVLLMVVNPIIRKAS